MLGGKGGGRRGEEKEGGRRYKGRNLKGFWGLIFWEIYERKRGSNFITKEKRTLEEGVKSRILGGGKLKGTIL